MFLGVNTVWTISNAYKFGIVLLILTITLCSPGIADAAIACFECHGTCSPTDYRPVDASYRNASSGGFQGNHRTHMGSIAVPSTCAACHPGSDTYTSSHRDGRIKVSSHLNASPLTTAYKNSTSAFPQTATPALGSCANVNCHFEAVTPIWGSSSASTACNTCHGAPGASGAHNKHDSYFSFASNGCVRCHPDYKTGLKFMHATSVGHVGRRINVALTIGSYSGTALNFLPSQSGLRTFGTCSGTYCHSNGASVATGSIPANTSPGWSSSILLCNGCHGNDTYSDDRKAFPLYTSGKPKANSHSLHAVHIIDCSVCHNGTTTTGNSITDSNRHVNMVYDLQAKAGSTFTYSFNSAGGSCVSVSCHEAAQWGGRTPGGTGCIACHGHSSGYEYESGKFSQGKGTWKVHASHTQSDGANRRGPNLACNACHDTDYFPYFKTGTDGNGDGRISLVETDVCDVCHSSGGTYNGLDDAAIGAKTNWNSLGVYDGNALRAGKENWCLGCHDSAPAVVSGQTAGNKAGNGTTYGYLITGHGKSSAYSRMSWQDTTANGNPSANKGCMECHDSTKSHINTGASNTRLKSGYGNENNTNCYQCHKSGGMANNAPVFYTTSSAYKASAHNSKLCSDCHDVHGSTGAFTGMTKADKQALCAQCHSNGGHPGVGSTSFTANGKIYTLQCTSCHNVHVITGTYAQADQNKSPVSRFTDNTHVWGAVSGEKMAAYAGGGTYRTPNGESFSGSQLPDYATFCQDCHGQSGSAPFGIDWGGDPHGNQSANQPNGYGTCPNWFACGNAIGWDGDDCTADNKANCWPVMTKGKGDQIYSRDAYTHTERIAGTNFVLSCTDCHTGHGTGTLGRSNINGNGAFTSNWNNMCNRCHYYYSDFHAGMSCGTSSCHVSNSIHRMANKTGSGGTRTFNPDLVLHYAFEGNLQDSGTWQMDGKWYSTAGSFAAGKTGQAAVLGEDKTVQVGTENGYWSTDEGYHGTWKFTEMKFNTTLEAWVNPTDNAKSEYTIFNKNVGVSTNGGYSFTLKRIGGTLRAAFSMAADNNGVTQDGRAGVRGAYSSIAVPLNKWTHVATVFDKDGPDRNPSDPSAGRIRIYVNGVDVTTSDTSGNNMQPGANETSIYAYSENSPWNQAGVCFNDSWCASEFSIGGFDWESTNFIGMIDDAKVWNVTKNAAYFSSYQAQAGPYISSVEGLIGSNQLTVTFSEGVYTNTGSSGALVSADFVLIDTGGNNPKTITGVTHTAGSATATITMSAPLVVADVSVDTLAAATNAIHDKDNLAAGTEVVTIGLSSQCPTSPITLQFNEASGSSYVMDTQNILYGAVYGGASTLTGSAYSGGGDGSGRYIDFQYNTACLQADRKMTIETRIKPTGISGTGNYVRRIMARDNNGNFQFSLWRNDSVSDLDPPSGVVTVALWVKPVDPNPYPATVWKAVLSDFNTCRIVTDHWYLVKAAWDSDATGIPVKIYMDDQGTDGSGAGENWAGYIDCTDSDQSQMPADKRVKQGDSLPKAAEAFKVGAHLTTPTNNLFNGLIDWIIWKDSVE